ncbi:MAG: redoxin domain-containing protein [Bacteroidota bacterium]
MMKTNFTLLVTLFASLLAAQSPTTQIQFEIEGYEEDFMAIANNLLDNQYIVDTVWRDDNGVFIYEREEAMSPGIYLAVMAPQNDYFQFLVTEEEQQFSIKNSVADQVKGAQIEGSQENEHFFSYLGYLQEAGERNQAMRAQLESEDLSMADKTRLERELTELDEQVKAHQEDWLVTAPNSFVTAIIKANKNVEPPSFEEISDTDARRSAQLRYLQEHYLDNLDLQDPRLLRTPFLFQRINFFVERLHVQAPDSISVAIDRVLGRMDTESETFKYYLIHYLNKAANSEFVGMDAIYVHLIDNYYAKGLAPWTEEEQLASFLDNANRLRPLLIGEIAPDIQMQTREGNSISLHEIDSEYTVLYFWRYDCGHCKESTPFMKEFYDKWQERGVTLFAVCAKNADDVGECWEYVDEKEIGDWLHTVDPYLRSRYAVKYDLQTTPQIYVLDANKEIVSKRISAEQLDELMELITAEEEEGR